MSTVKITALKNGPYKVEGPIELYYDTVPVNTAGSVNTSLADVQLRNVVPSVSVNTIMNSAHR